MMSSRIARLSFSAAVALGLPLGAVALAASPASAATKTITCNKVTGSVSAGSIKLKKCNGNTGTKSKAISIATFASGGVVTWANGKTTTFGAPTLGTGTNCAAGDTDETFTGTVTADTTHSVKPIPGTYAGEVCISSTGAITNAPGVPVTVN